MLCDECKRNEATYHSIKKMNGSTSERHLCTECQKKYGGFKTMKVSGLSDFFSNLSAMLQPSIARDYDDRVCRTCGTSADEFLNSGFVGCANCYKELSAVVLPMVQKMQGDIQHVGKAPDGKQSESTEYERLKKELNKAIELENYEQASVIRDKMKTVSGGQK